MQSRNGDTFLVCVSVVATERPFETFEFFETSPTIR